MQFKYILGGMGVFGVLVINSSAVSVDLTTVGASGTANGGVFTQIAPQPTGTGVIDPFLRIQSKGSEHGFNNNVNAFTLDDVAKGGQTWNHDIRLGDVPIVNGFYRFLLDINEENAGTRRLLSMHEMEIWLRPSPLTTFAGSAGVYTDLSLSGAVKRWDLDLGSDGNSVVELNYSLNHGSGSGDMYADIPVSALGTDDSQYVYLYSAFGSPNASGAGFEEWAVQTANRIPPPGGGGNVPDGGSTLLLLSGGLFGLRLLQYRLKKA